MTETEKNEANEMMTVIRTTCIRTTCTLQTKRQSVVVLTGVSAKESWFLNKFMIEVAPEYHGPLEHSELQTWLQENITGSFIQSLGGLTYWFDSKLDATKFKLR